MERTSKGLRVSLGILIALLISSVWIAVFAAVPTIETPATSSRGSRCIDPSGSSVPKRRCCAGHSNAIFATAADEPPRANSVA